MQNPEQITGNVPFNGYHKPWEQLFEELLNFIHYNGFIPGGPRNRTATDVEGELVGWVTHQLMNYIFNEVAIQEWALNPERIELLESVENWTWNWEILQNRNPPDGKKIPYSSKLEKDFQSKIDAIKKYKISTGRFPSIGDLDHSGIDLGTWTDRMKYNYHIGKLNSSRVKIFESLDGWDWNRDDFIKKKEEQIWKDKFQVLLDYCFYTGCYPDQRIDGHSSIIHLGTWASEIKKTFEIGALEDWQNSRMMALKLYCEF